jgi:hypothetical protein
MREPLERRPETTAQKFLKYFSLFMTLVYPAFGLYLILSSPQQLDLHPQVKLILGIVLILYGIFRFYRTYTRYFKNTTRHDI